MTAPALAVFGARRGVGLELAAAARRAGRQVIAVIRPEAADAALRALGCDVVRADALAPEAVEAVFAALPRGVVVASTLGGRDGIVDDRGNRAVIDAAAAHGAARLLLVSSLGAGESRAHASPALLAAIGEVLLAKTRAEDHLRASGVPFTIIRPGGLVDGPATGHGELSRAMDVHGFVARGELAAMALAALADDACLDAVFSAVDPGCRPSR